MGTGEGRSRQNFSLLIQGGSLKLIIMATGDVINTRHYGYGGGGVIKTLNFGYGGLSKQNFKRILHSEPN